MEIDEKTLYRSIGEQLKNQRVMLGYTQGQVADIVGITRTSVTNIESGYQKLPIHLLYSICASLDLEVTSILPKTDQVEVRDVGKLVSEQPNDVKNFYGRYIVKEDEK